MENTRRSPRNAANAKKKMTKEQMQLAIIKKKECDAKAQAIVEKLIEPKIDCEWLIENLRNINKCHLEDVIEERAITKVCGYVLCQNPITVKINQRYHISLRDKKVYDVTKRKNFCSSNCFGASNYLLEQMLTSPLWLRDKEEIPKFKIFSRDKVICTTTPKHGDEIDISIIEQFTKDDADSEKNYEDVSKKKEEKNVGCIEEYVFKTLEKMNDIQEKKQGNDKSNTSDVKADNNDKKDGVVEKFKKEENIIDSNMDESANNILDVIKEDEEKVDNNVSCQNMIGKNKVDDDDAIVQYVYPVEETFLEKPVLVKICDKTLQYDREKVKDAMKANQSQETQEKTSEKPKSIFKKRRSRELQKQSVEVNLAAGVEESFKEWITDETKAFLYGEDSVKQQTIEKIERQDRYTMLCQKLNKLQFQEDEEDAEILEKPKLKPAPHFAVLQEEGKKLDLKVRAFFQGKTEIQEPPPTSSVEEDNTDTDAFLPLTDSHAPQIMRRKILLEKLDQVLPDLLRTLAGNNEVYQKASFNYTSFRCTAVKALIHTFSLSPKNIIFKSAELTLVGLIIVKMLSLLDPWLASLLLSKQANMYVSMILTSYKLDAHYLNLFVASFNPNVNPR